MCMSKRRKNQPNHAAKADFAFCGDRDDGGAASSEKSERKDAGRPEVA